MSDFALVKDGEFAGYAAGDLALGPNVNAIKQQGRRDWSSLPAPSLKNRKVWRRHPVTREWENIADGVMPVQRTAPPDRRFYTIGGETRTVGADAVTVGFQTSERTVDAIKATLKAEINELRDQKIGAGLEYTVGPDTYVIDTDKNSRDTLDSIITSINSGFGVPPQTGGWRDRNNQTLVFSTEQVAKDLALAGRNQYDAIWAVSWAKKAEIDALTTHAELVAYDMAADWPAVPDA